MDKKKNNILYTFKLCFLIISNKINISSNCYLNHLMQNFVWKI